MSLHYVLSQRYKEIKCHKEIDVCTTNLAFVYFCGPLLRFHLCRKNRVISFFKAFEPPAYFSASDACVQAVQGGPIGLDQEKKLFYTVSKGSENTFV